MFPNKILALIGDFRSLVLIAAMLAGVSVQADWISDEQAIMGTRIRVEIWSEDQAAQAAVSAVMDEMHRIDRLMSTYKESSEISEVNRDAASRAVVVGYELFELIKRALDLSVTTNGAFDITYASVGYLYDYRERERPDEAHIEAALESIDYHLVKLDEESGSIRFVRDGVRIDLGGIAKGYAVERGAAILRDAGIESAIVTAGGDSRVIGDRRGKPWIVGIQDPRMENVVIARLPLADEAISTSGDYERYFEEDGVRYHHIISPSTGKPASSVHSVTIVGPDATMTDGLSTSVFVLGVEKGLGLINRTPDYEAVIVDPKGDLHTSDGFSDTSL